jgi:DHA2 family multidrug resistance protein
VGHWDPAVLNAEVARQAGMIAFLNDFRLMTAVCLLSMPLVLLLRPPARSKAMRTAPQPAGE